MVQILHNKLKLMLKRVMKKKGLQSIDKALKVLLEI